MAKTKLDFISSPDVRRLGVEVEGRTFVHFQSVFYLIEVVNWS